MLPGRGFFLTLEGPEGCGKTTQARLLHEHFAASGVPTVLTREPGGTVLGDKMRELLLDPVHGPVADRAELLLYEAARAQHVEQVIRPALVRGALVICDRFADSSTVYQGYALGLGVESVVELNCFATGGITPDLTVVIDVAVETGLRRAQEAGELDRIESRPESYHQRVREGFLQLAQQEPERFTVVSGSREPESLHRELVDLVTARWDCLQAGNPSG